MIILYPNDILKSVCEEVVDINDDFIKQIEAMREAMYKNDGCGLAAPQVGILKRFFIADCNDNIGFETFINPKIIKKSSDYVLEMEGCLSFPEKFIPVKRHKSVTIEYTNLKGKRKTLNCKGLLSRCIQHENDHLNAILYIEKEEK